MSDGIALAASVVVGAVLLVAGAAKIAARERWAGDAAALGAPSWAVPIVPWFEIALGAVLVAQVARRPSAIAAAIVFVAFTALIIRSLRRGDRPVCACFGAWSTRPIGVRDVARNTALLCLSVIAAV